MKTVRIQDKNNMISVETYQGECIERKVQRIVNENEPIEDGAPIIFQERADGVRPEFNIRTDRWDVAIEAMEKVSTEELSKYTKSQEQPGKGIERKKEQKVETTTQTEEQTTKPVEN